MTEDEKQALKSVKQELSALWIRFLAVENAKPKDYSETIFDIQKQLAQFGSAFGALIDQNLAGIEKQQKHLSEDLEIVIKRVDRLESKPVTENPFYRWFKR